MTVRRQPGPAALLLVLILNAIPSGEKQAAKSQMLLPLGTLCNLGQSKVPIGVTLLLVVWANGFMENAGFAGQVDLNHFVLIGILPLIVAILYTLFAHRLLPRHEIATAVEEDKSVKAEKMSKWHEIVVYFVFRRKR